MWTKEKIKKFIAAHPIHTDGSIANYKCSNIETAEDGDITHEVIFPFWCNNLSVVGSLLNMLQDIIKAGDAYIYPEKDKVRVLFYEHACDPD